MMAQYSQNYTPDFSLPTLNARHAVTNRFKTQTIDKIPTFRVPKLKLKD